jgi:hypothetical protein
MPEMTHYGQPLFQNIKTGRGLHPYGCQPFAFRKYQLRMNCAAWYNDIRDGTEQN